LFAVDNVILSMVPFELLLYIAEYLPLSDIWSKRRINSFWKNAMEQAFVQQIQQEPLIMHVYLLNSRGGPWFSFSSESVEDYIKIPLVVSVVDQENKIIRFQQAPTTRNHNIYGQVEQPRLFRRSTLDRMQWCVKIQIQTKDSTEKKYSKKKLCTLIAPDTNLSPDKSHGSITTFDMQLLYEVFDDPISNGQSALDLKITSFKCTYSYFFSKLDCDKHEFYGSWSVHPKEKQTILLKVSKEMNLEWSECYWSFDLVLHWLTFGDPEMAPSVVEFLLEHNMQHPNTTKVQKRRFYRSDSVELI
jgi:hypothetical protein